MLTQRAQHIQELMVQSMQTITPDVKVKAEPALMFRWQKSAEPYFAGDTLLPWELVPRDKDGKPVEWMDLTAVERQGMMDRLENLYDKAEQIRKG